MRKPYSTRVFLRCWSPWYMPRTWGIDWWLSSITITTSLGR